MTFFCLAFLFSIAQASDTLPVKLAAKLEKWLKNYPTEKLYLHTDKSAYIAGETIWYKAYLTLDNAPTYLSKIIYVEVVDDKGKVVDKQMRPLVNGSTHGDIAIDRNLPTGNYSVNAYSLWMLNFESFIFRKNIRIYNADYKAKAGNGKVAQTDFSLQFFPEGGDLVEGLKTTVALYSVNNQGLPIATKGFITDESGKQVAPFETTAKGYGKVEITPVSGQVFYAAVNYGGVQKKIKLPLAKKEGIAISVNNLNANRTFVQVQRSIANPAKYNNLWVFAQMYGKPVFVGLVNFSEDATGMSIQKKTLPSGVLHITVFDNEGNPLAERLAFVNNHNLNILNIATDSFSLKQRGKNKFTLDLSVFTDPSVSVAVTDADVASGIHQENNILSNLLLTSDIKGYVHQPGFYFKDKNPETVEQLDLLMMTHGWRRFRWEDVMKEKDLALQYPVESGISVTGKLTVPQSTKAITAGHVDIVTKGEDSTTILSKAIVNANGDFGVTDLNFKQRATLYLQGSRQDNKNAFVDVIVNKAYIDSLRFSKFTPTIDLDTVAAGSREDTKLKNLLAEEVAKNRLGSTLANVTISTKKVSRIDSLNNTYASAMFQMGQNLEITASHYLSIWQFLREQVNGLVVEGDLNNPNVYFNRFAGTRIFASQLEEEGTNMAGGMESNGITYYLNEINVSNDVINTIHPSDVAMIKVFRGPEGAALGMNEGGIAIYTKKGLPSKTRTGEKGFFTERKLGYAVTREFFNPDYSVPVDASYTDNRTTLYWNPNLRTDKAGKATIRFYNNDSTKKYKIVVQGIDKKGSVVLKEQIIE